VFCVDLTLDSVCGFLETIQNFIDSFFDPSSFLCYLMEFDAGTLDVALEKVAIDKCRSNRQAG
jgi:hypothetical protein